MPRLLADIEVYRQLKTLRDWDGDAGRISRTVTSAEPDALVAAVTAEADHVRHPPEVQREGDRVTFALWTHSLGGVTQLDIELAHRLDAVIRAYE